MSVATRPFGGGGEAISLLGFGCMRLPTVGGDAKVIDEPLARRMVDYALDHGVNYFDTAFPYHGGHSEPFIGEALARHPRDRYHLATKMPPWSVKTEADVDRIFEEQLRRCRVEHFDFYLGHHMTGRTFDSCVRLRVFEKLLKRKERGQIKRLGFSFHDQLDVLDRILLMYPLDFVQLQINYLDWTTQNAAAQYARAQRAGLPVSVMEPLRGGTLARLTDRAAAILRDAAPDASPASWALRYAASLPGVFTVLSGMSDFEHMEDNVATFEAFRPLDDAERATLEKALAAYREAGTIPCTGCGYCMDCPSGVDIPRMFAIYNQHRARGVRDPYFGLDYDLAGRDANAERCVKCGACVPKCPQRIDIPARLADVSAAVAALRKG